MRGVHGGKLRLVCPYVPVGVRLDGPRCFRERKRRKKKSKERSGWRLVCVRREAARCLHELDRMFNEPLVTQADSSAERRAAREARTI